MALWPGCNTACMESNDGFRFQSTSAVQRLLSATNARFRVSQFYEFGNRLAFSCKPPGNRAARGITGSDDKNGFLFVHGALLLKKIVGTWLRNRLFHRLGVALPALISFSPALITAFNSSC